MLCQLELVLLGLPAVVTAKMPGRLRDLLDARHPWRSSAPPSTVPRQPEPPPSFQEPRRVQRLVQKMKGLSGEPSPAEDEPSAAAHADPPPRRPAEQPAPGRVRTCLASLHKSQAFAPLVAAAAQRRGFYQAARRAFLGDGQAYNWTIHRGYFRDFEPIVDFLHVLCYVYLAAWAVGSSEEERWSVYLGCRWAWPDASSTFVTATVARL